MKSQAEIQRAHDQLAAIGRGEIKLNLPPHILDAVRCQCSVLCWILDHEHNPTFANALKSLDELALSCGYVLENHGN